MSWPDESIRSEWQQTMIGAMRDELDWAPFSFQGWAAYERVRAIVPSARRARWTVCHRVQNHGKRRR